MKMGRPTPAHLFGDRPIAHEMARLGAESVAISTARGKANLRDLAIRLPCRIDKFFGR
jgi:hypothetical protein